MLRQLFTIAAVLAGTICGVDAAAVASNHTLSPRVNVNLRFPYGSQVVRGMNIGGWLVLEPWITPSLFEQTGNGGIIDEWTFGQYQDYNTAQNALVNHWNTWFTEADFAAIANAGMNHVRIPIGYWAFDISQGEPYHTGQYPYLKQAVIWCRNHGLKVLIDLHGVPGSQNGFDNSGHFGAANWATSSSNILRTQAIIETLAAEFSQDVYGDVVTAIAPINEPAGFLSSDIIAKAKQLYYDSYGMLRYPYGSSPIGNLLLVIHDAFQTPITYWNGFMTDFTTYNGVAMDTHSYNIFSQSELQNNWPQHIATMCARGNSYASFAASNIWTIVGEWTIASTDCAKYLNGRNIGSRYDGSYPGSSYIANCGPVTGSSSGFSADYKVFLRQFYEAQVAAYECAQGWFYWTWKAENADDWSYLAGLNGGWIPWNPSERKYGNICGF